MTRLPLLVEQDFGYYEGKSFASRPQAGKKSGKQDPHEQHRREPGFKEPESKESMAVRMDKFLDEHLFPLLLKDKVEKEFHVAIVSHGLIMPVLWRQMVLHLPFESLDAMPEVVSARGQMPFDRLGAWSNTGYTLLDLQRSIKYNLTTLSHTYPKFIAYVATGGETARSNDAKLTPVLREFTVKILAMNSLEHLRGLKRTGGGVGSSRHDETQKTIDTFFKRRRVS